MGAVMAWRPCVHPPCAPPHRQHHLTNCPTANQPTTNQPTVCSYADLKELGDEHKVKAAGKYRQQGKEYVVGDGDIIYFKVGGLAGLPTAFVLLVHCLCTACWPLRCMLARHLGYSGG